MQLHLKTLESSKNVNNLNLRILTSFLLKIELLLVKISTIKSKDEVKQQIKTIDGCFKQLEEIPKFEIPKLIATTDMDFEKAGRAMETLYESSRQIHRENTLNCQISTRLNNSNFVFQRFKGKTERTIDIDRLLQKIKSKYRLNKSETKNDKFIENSTINLMNNDEGKVLERLKSMRRVEKLENRANLSKSFFFVNQHRFLSTLKNDIGFKNNKFAKAS